MERSRKTLDPGRAAALGRASAAARARLAPDERRAYTQAAREAQAARRLEVTKAKVAREGLASLTRAELTRLSDAIVGEQIARERRHRAETRGRKPAKPSPEATTAPERTVPVSDSSPEAVAAYQTLARCRTILRALRRLAAEYEEAAEAARQKSLELAREARELGDVVLRLQTDADTAYGFTLADDPVRWGLFWADAEAADHE